MFRERMFLEIKANLLKLSHMLKGPRDKTQHAILARTLGKKVLKLPSWETALGMYPLSGGITQRPGPSKYARGAKEMEGSLKVLPQHL